MYACVLVCFCKTTLRLVEGIRAALDAPPWLLVQFQERGSYRTEDVLEFLEWALEPAACPQESTIVMLDWFSAHLAPEVAELVARKGHLLILHGGGVTGLEQVNDAWLAYVRSGFEHILALSESLVTPYIAMHLRSVDGALIHAHAQCPVKDTHLHALFQRLMEQTEVPVAHAARKDDPDRVPKLSRQGILDVVREASPKDNRSSKR